MTILKLRRLFYDSIKQVIVSTFPQTQIVISHLGIIQETHLYSYVISLQLLFVSFGQTVLFNICPENTLLNQEYIIICGVQNSHISLTLKLEMGKWSYSHLRTCQEITPSSRIIRIIIQKVDQQKQAKNLGKFKPFAL